MITPAELGLWLLADPVGHSQSMIDLIDSNDMVIVADGESFGMKRRHNDVISHYETGSALPLLPLTLA